LPAPTRSVPGIADGDTFAYKALKPHFLAWHCRGSNNTSHPSAAHDSQLPSPCRSGGIGLGNPITIAPCSVPEMASNRWEALLSYSK
jgi:hypothetical protein